LSIKRGDAVTACVAAASIVAKVERDRTMERYSRRYPEFGFDHNRGYGTAEHWAVLVRLGPTAIHRLSFRGVANPRPREGPTPTWPAPGGEAAEGPGPPELRAGWPTPVG
jgi:ribonuclease HII